MRWPQYFPERFCLSQHMTWSIHCCKMLNKAMVWDCLHSALLRFGSPTFCRYAHGNL